jgi:hypothetical protein
MAKKKAKAKKAKKAKKKRGPGAKKKAAADKKRQQQYYITQSLIDSVEKLRTKKEAEMRKRFGPSFELTTSQFIGLILSGLVKKAKKAGTL